ncbi:translocation protein TolB [Caedimonas varicaedens]|uniref:Tol-Pal system protein TolB n=1 Tax=Caedimonas varicaedens TaxID=1629334 RepID=A0A0K8MCT9_9PROT|nr:translocation protein TolB [Caedimonas varicaedens]
MSHYIKKVLYLLTLVGGVFLGLFGLKAEELTIDITQGTIAPMPVAITSFYGASPELANLGTQISSIVSADLKGCGLFKPLDPSSFVQTLDSLRQQGPRFADWRLINTQTLVKGDITLMNDGRFRVEFRLYDVIAENQMEGLAFMATAQDYRRVAHKIADAIYKRITGDEGYFDTKIAYVSQTGPSTKRIKRLAIMDQDGANHRFLSTGQSLVLTPRFSPKAQEIAYIDFNHIQPKVYMMNLSSGQRQLLGNFKGMTFAPHFSPDGSSVIMSFAAGGRTSLYNMNLGTRAIARITEGAQIDTSPCYSPDGNQIVFNSDRGGSAQLYVMPARGGDAERISFGKGSYRTPVWSPRGDWITFTKLSKGSFYIGVMKPDGSGERLLAQGYVIDDPCWSPNGRVIMFTRLERTGKSRMYAVDLTGYNERVIPTPTDAAGGCWSPLIR